MITLDSTFPCGVCRIVCVGADGINDDGRDVLIQSDIEAPAVASVFDWNTRRVQANGLHCLHPNTDGTIDCRCGVTASMFIESACEWLREHDGATAEDPGYFA